MPWSRESRASGDGKRGISPLPGEECIRIARRAEQAAAFWLASTILLLLLTIMLLSSDRAGTPAEAN